MSTHAGWRLCGLGAEDGLPQEHRAAVGGEATDFFDGFNLYSWPREAPLLEPALLPAADPQPST